MEIMLLCLLSIQSMAVCLQSNGVLLAIRACCTCVMRLGSKTQLSIYPSDTHIVRAKPLDSCSHTRHPSVYSLSFSNVSYSFAA
ncbi:hypothetical protein BD310DRAFT_917792 [Dichomitus squalens]|uniref:Secreted protein n=1 Tax=Dichomitus squalens TaxID=114155 RepID=A0A4V6MWX6_9APHY|nr:hypothetical protein BD310DRAFT_917792 [Dichomitus squalens]